jgi:rare lipoprotein A
MAGVYERERSQRPWEFGAFGVSDSVRTPASESGRYKGLARKRGRRDCSSKFHFKLRVAHFAALVCLAAVFVTGCGGRRTVAARRSAPVQPNTTSTAPGGKTDANANSASPHSNANTNGQSGEQAGEPFEEGKASWYGAPFHGRRASNGEVYDMNKLTAAHRTLPFNTVVRVTNMTNGKSTTVRITDRGPFVDNRIIDLSFAAAKEIESVGPGVVPVRLDILSAIDPTAGFFTVQIGAFRERANAERLRTRLGASYSPIQIVEFPIESGALYRVRVGKIAGEQAAQQLGQQLREQEGVKPIIFRLDDAGNGGGNP